MLCSKHSWLVCLSVPLLAASQAQDSALPRACHFTLFAGGYSAGSADGTLKEARFDYPYGIAIDSTDNLYISDRNNHTIRKITPAGIVSTLAGSRRAPAGTADGQGNAARFAWPGALTIGSDQVLYVADGTRYADTLGPRIRRITANGTVTTLAGYFSAGSLDGQGTDARFSNVTDITLDRVGNILAADDGAIRRITASGIVSTLLPADQGYATSLAADTTGLLYFTGHRGLNILSPTGHVMRLAGAQTTGRTTGNTRLSAGQGLNASFDTPQDVVFDQQGNLIVLDKFADLLRHYALPQPVLAFAHVTPQGFVSWRPLDLTAVPAMDAWDNYSLQMAIDSKGTIYFPDAPGNVIRQLTPDGKVENYTGLARETSMGYTDGQAYTARFTSPQAIEVGPNGEIYVVDSIQIDRTYPLIRRLDAAGTVTTFAGTHAASGRSDAETAANLRFGTINDLAATKTGLLYVAEDTIRKITANGAVSVFISAKAHGLGLDQDNNLYYTLAQEVWRANHDGVKTRVTAFDQWVNQRTSFGDIVVDKTGAIYVCDRNNNRVIRLRSSGQSTALVAQDASFSYPVKLALDGQDRLFVLQKLGAALEFPSLIGMLGADDTIHVIPHQYTDGQGKPNHINALAIDRHSGALYASASVLSQYLQTGGAGILKGSLATAPSITTQPQSLVIRTGDSAQFSVTATGTPAPAYQWFYNGQPYVGATDRTLSVSNARLADAGEYTVVVTNDLGSLTSHPATLTVTNSPTPPPDTTPAPGGSRGGGAPSVWFLLALLVLLPIHQSGRRKNPSPALL